MNSSFRYFVLALLISFLLPPRAEAQFGNNNPTGVAGDYNGTITTAGSYDPFTGNASREIEDIVVAGSVGAYPLKWVRRLNTRAALPGNPLGGAGGWSHSYQWELTMYHPAPPTPTPTPPIPDGNPDGLLTYPDGRTAVFTEPWNLGCCDAAENGPFGTLDRLVDLGGGHRDLQLGDGGVVHFQAVSLGSIYYNATSIVDPYRQTITLEYEQGLLKRIKEPGGANARYLEITYEEKSSPVLTVIKKVEANDGFGNVTQSVTYDYTLLTTTFSYPLQYISYWYLTRADYSDGTHASYDYQDTNAPRLFQGDGDAVFYKLVSRCEDVRFAGPMRTIKYDYTLRANGSRWVAWGQVRGEKNENEDLLSWSEYPVPTPGVPPENTWRKEHRADGSIREFDYQVAAYVSQYSDFLNHWSQNNITHDTDGSSHCQFTDANGKMTDKWREANFGATIRVTHPAPSNSHVDTTYTDTAQPHYVAVRTDERQNPTQYIRYSDSHMIQQINYPDGGSEQFTYNGFGQVQDHTMTSGGIEHFLYDTRGLKMLYWPPPTASFPNPETHKTQYFYYDANNSSGRFDRIDRLWYVIDPLDHTTIFDYNQRGQLTRVTHHDGSFAQSAYNDDGTLAWTADENHPNADERTQYQYDVYKRVTRITNPLGQFTTYDYTPRNGLGPLSHTTSSVYRVTSPAQKVTAYDYDLNFRRIQMIQAPDTPDVAATTTYHYDPVGNLDWVDDPRVYRTTYGYDERNRQTTITNFALNETTTVEYDYASNKIAERRPDTTARGWDYDSMNRLLHAYDWYATGPLRAAPTTTYVHDLAGNVHRITDAKGSVYVYEYDELNRKKSATYPADAYSTSRTETWHYDFAGNLDQYTNPAVQLRHLHYDNRNRQDHSWWDGNVGPAVVTRYDAASRVIRVLANSALMGGMAPDEISAETMVSFGYDDANRKIWEEQTLTGHPTRRVQTDLNFDGTRHNLQIVDPLGGGANYFWPKMQGTSYLVNYDYTERNQLMAVSAEDWSFNYSYDRSGNMTARAAVYNGVSSATNCLDYDALNRPTIWEQTSSSLGGRFALSRYQYDNVNRERATSRDEDNGSGEQFTYEPTNQLASAVYTAQNPTRTVTYGYTADKLNRSTVTDTDNGGSVTTYTNPSGVNQYGSVAGVNYSYDGNFNLTGADTLTVTYDAANHVVSAIHHRPIAGDINVQFVYDGLGRCVKRTISGYGATFAYDDWKPIAEWDDWNGCQAWNVYGPGADEILVRYQDKYGYIRFHLDRHGNVAFLINNDGNGLEKYTYDIFGLPTITDYSSGNVHPYSYYGHRFLFQGRDYIHELGLSDYRHRFYHPALGRFLQTDPTGFGAGDMNLFRYCGDDPVDGSDPLGLEEDQDLKPPRALERLMATSRETVKTASFESKDRFGRMQLILQRKSDRGFETQPTLNVGKKVKGDVVGGLQRYVEQEQATYNSDKYGLAAIEHVHMNKTGLAESRFSKFDLDRAREGAFVEKVNESTPDIVQRRTPQKDGSEPQTREFRSGESNSGASQQSQDSAQSQQAQLTQQMNASLLDAALYLAFGLGGGQAGEGFHPAARP